MQDYKYLRIAVMICAALVNIQTHTQRIAELKKTNKSAQKTK